MFTKLLKAMDFAPNYKTLVSSIAFVIAAILATQGIPVTGVEITTLAWALYNNTYVVVSACGVIYGLVMKFVRKFNK